MGYHTSIKSSRKKTVKILIENFEKKQRSWNSEDLKFSINLIDISQFENHNSSISVNVVDYEKLINPLRVSEHNYKREITVNLLLISDDTKQHYCWITDISKLLSLQTSRHGQVRHICFRCLNTFNSVKSLASYHEYCKSCEAIKIELPEKGSKISF